MDIYFDHIEARSLVDGPGERTVLFMKGCNLACPGCQNQHLWPMNSKNTADPFILAKAMAQIASHTGNVTISGGEPFLQIDALWTLIISLRAYGVRNIILYTGFTWEYLLSGLAGNVLEILQILKKIDILVDGPFIKSLDHDHINYRGSSNQRPIDVQATLASLEIGSSDFPVVLNWDAPQIQIGIDGDAVMPVGLAHELAALGTVEKNRMCGQTR